MGLDFWFKPKTELILNNEQILQCPLLSRKMHTENAKNTANLNVSELLHVVHPDDREVSYEGTLN